MSTIKLYILGALVDEGPMHGYELRRRAEHGQIQNWTDIPVTALYGALKRLLAEGYVAETRVERDGARPERQIVAITAEGRAFLERLARETLGGFDLPPDPIDIVLARPGDVLDDLDDIIAARLREARRQLAGYLLVIERLRPDLTKAEILAMRHHEYRLRAEIAFLSEALATVPDVIAEEGGR